MATMSMGHQVQEPSTSFNIRRRVKEKWGGEGRGNQGKQCSYLEHIGLIPKPPEHYSAYNPMRVPVPMLGWWKKRWWPPG